MDLSTKYLGLDLKHPVVASSSPWSRTLDGVRSLEDGGVSAIVLYSIFEESEHYDAYLEHVRQCREAVDIPIIGSLACASVHGWTEYARGIEQAGANALELNLYYLPTDMEESSAEVEARYVETLSAVKAQVDVPVAVKLGPYFSALGAMAKRLDAAGADALVLFNRFYRPDLDIDTLEITPTLELSRPNEIRLGLFWIGLLHGKLNAALAATSGVNSDHEIIKYLLVGADVVMMTSALLRLGADYTEGLIEGLQFWGMQKGYKSLAEARGLLSHGNLDDPSAYERANYISVLQEYATPKG